MTDQNLLNIYKETGSTATAVHSLVKAKIDLAECSFALSGHKTPEIQVPPTAMLHGLVRSVALLGESTKETEMVAAALLAAKHNYSQADGDGFSQVETVISGYFSLDKDQQGRLSRAKIESIEQVRGFEIRTDEPKTIHVDRIRYTNIPGNEGMGYSAEITGIDHETKRPIVLMVLHDRDGKAFQDALARTPGAGSLVISGKLTVAGNENGFVATIAESNIEKKLQLEVGGVAERPAPETKSHPIKPKYAFEQAQSAAGQPVMYVKGDGATFIATGHRLNAELRRAADAKPKAILATYEMPQMRGYWKTRIVNGRSGSAFIVEDIHNPTRAKALQQSPVKPADISPAKRGPVGLER